MEPEQEELSAATAAEFARLAELRQNQQDVVRLLELAAALTTAGTGIPPPAIGGDGNGDGEAPVPLTEEEVREKAAEAARRLNELQQSLRRHIASIEAELR